MKTKTQFLSKNSNILKYIIPPFILSLITFIFYLPSLKYPFQFDDAPNITKLFNIRNKDFDSLFFTGPRWIIKWLNTINYKIGEFDPLVYRCFNLLFHIISGILVFYFMYLALSGLKKNNYFKENALIISSLTSALFLLHPVQTQTVSYVIQGQLEGLATLFVLAIVFCYLCLSKTTNLISKIFLTILLLLLTIFSTGTKEIAIVAPFLVVITDWFFIAQGSWQSLKKRIPLQLIIFILSFGIFIYYQKPQFIADILGLKLTAYNNLGNTLTDTALEPITPFAFFISQFKVILHYLFIFIWPFNISVEYHWKLCKGFFALDCVIPFIILLMILSFIIYLLRKNSINLIAFGLIWFFIAIMPRSSFIPSAELLVDYKTYLASVGWLLILAYGISVFFDFICAKLISKKSNHEAINKTKIVLFILLAVILGFLSYQRNKVWRTSLEFWENIVANAPKARAFNNYGVELSGVGKYHEAIPYFKKAIAMEGSTYWDPYTNLAAAYAIIGKTDLAIATLRQSLMINKYQPEAYNNLGAFLLHKKEWDAAEKSFFAALEIMPHFGKAMYNYGRLYLAKHDVPKAWEYFKKACTQGDLDHDPVTFNMYASTSIHLKKYDDAIFAYKKILDLTNNPRTFNETLFNLGNAYFLNDQLKEASQVFNELIKRDPNDYRAWCNLIETLIEMQEFKNAMELITKAKENKIYFEGIEIQEAKCLANLDYTDLAIEVLTNFIKKPDASGSLKDMARKMIIKIKKMQ